MHPPRRRRTKLKSITAALELPYDHALLTQGVFVLAGRKHMNRGVKCATTAMLLFASLSGELATAAERGFYFGVTASRVKHDVEGIPGIPLLIAFPTLPPGFGYIGPIFPIPITPSPPYAQLAVTTEINDVDAGFSGLVGYRINRYFAAELTYTDFGEYERIERFAGFPNFRYELGVTGTSVSVLGSLPLGEQWELFVRGGMLFADQDVSTKVITSMSRSYSDEVVIAGAGVEWAFAPRWSTRLEYQRTNDLKYGNTQGESSIDQASLSVLFKL
jgi:hypothetical protein